MTGKVLLIRHAQVALRWRGRCYGSTDVGLSRAGAKHSQEIARAILRRRDSRSIAAVFHSGLRRASHLAELIADTAGLEPRADERWRERDFGSWEARSWNSIWRESGNAMDRMLTDPAKFRPGGGETTAELFARSVRASRIVPGEGIVIVVTHGGPIACVRCHLANAGLPQLAKFRIEEGETIEFPQSRAHQSI